MKVGDRPKSRSPTASCVCLCVCGVFVVLGALKLPKPKSRLQGYGVDNIGYPQVDCRRNKVDTRSNLSRRLSRVRGKDKSSLGGLDRQKMICQINLPSSRAVAFSPLLYLVVRLKLYREEILLLPKRFDIGKGLPML